VEEAAFKEKLPEDVTLDGTVGKTVLAEELRLGGREGTETLLARWVDEILFEDVLE
jgi:hypothetical protein